MATLFHVSTNMKHTSKLEVIWEKKYKKKNVFIFIVVEAVAVCSVIFKHRINPPKKYMCTCGSFFCVFVTGVVFCFSYCNLMIIKRIESQVYSLFYACVGLFLGLMTDFIICKHAVHMNYYNYDYCCCCCCCCILVIFAD